MKGEHLLILLGLVALALLTYGRCGKDGSEKFRSLARSESSPCPPWETSVNTTFCKQQGALYCQNAWPGNQKCLQTVESNCQDLRYAGAACDLYCPNNCQYKYPGFANPQAKECSQNCFNNMNECAQYPGGGQ